LSGKREYIKHIQSDVKTIGTVDEIDIYRFVQINDDVLRRYPTKMGGGNPHNYGSWRRQVTHVLQHHGKSLIDKPCHTYTRNLVTDREYVVDVKNIWPFYYDPAYVTLNMAVKDIDETVVDMIVQQNFSDPRTMVS